MEVKAQAKYIKVSPRKVRLVTSLISGLSVQDALNQLQVVNKKVTLDITKLLKSAIANAENNFELDFNNLFVKEVKVNEGPTLKRWSPRARGRATPIRKRTSHIDIVLGELVDSGEKKGKKQKIAKPIKLGETLKEDKVVKTDSKTEKTENTDKKEIKEKGKEIHDPRAEGRGKNTKIEGKGAKGIGSKFFRRKAG